MALSLVLGASVLAIGPSTEGSDVFCIIDGPKASDLQGWHWQPDGFNTPKVFRSRGFVTRNS
jgi:hypothetical protein